MPDRSPLDRSTPVSPLPPAASRGQGRTERDRRAESLSRSIRLALDYGTPEQLRSLCMYQAEKIHRLTGGKDIGFPASDPFDPAAAPTAAVRTDRPPEALEVVERVLGFDDIFRKPPRVAAPRFLDHLTDLDYRLERK